MATKKKTGKRPSIEALQAQQRWAAKEIKELLNHIKNQPFPSQRSLEQEHKKLLQQEKRLAQMLIPLKELEKSIKAPRRRIKKKTSKNNFMKNTEVRIRNYLMSFLYTSLMIM